MLFAVSELDRGRSVPGLVFDRDLCHLGGFLPSVILLDDRGYSQLDLVLRTHLHPSHDLLSIPALLLEALASLPLQTQYFPP